MNGKAKLWERFLPNIVLGRHAICYETVKSTMDTAWELAEDGAPTGTAVLALTQSSGRGRFQRDWVSGNGESLLQSVIVRAEAAELSMLSMFACVATVRAVAEIAGISCQVKWPNDVQVHNRKLCGVLVESRIDTHGSGLAVLGYGLNLNMRFEGHPELEALATSLAIETGGSYRIADASDVVLRALDSAVAEGPTLVNEYRRLVTTVGRSVTIQRSGSLLVGLAEGIANSGALLVRDSTGVLHELRDGEVTLSTSGG